MLSVGVAKCDKCLRDFEPTPQQANLIARARAGRLKLAILVCPFCRRGITITEPNPSAEPPSLRCPCAGCIGWVSNILDARVAEPPPKWGCGECGEVWPDDRDGRGSGWARWRWTGEADSEEAKAACEAKEAD